MKIKINQDNSIDSKALQPAVLFELTRNDKLSFIGVYESMSYVK
ncbi:MAG: hypothetical protein ABJM06_13245 [Gilvibacter sp.]